MPMIDIHAPSGLFKDTSSLARRAAETVMRIEQVPDIPLFRKNTAAYVHDIPSNRVANVDGDTDYVRVQVLTNEGALTREQQLALVKELTVLLSDAANNPSLMNRVWVQLCEAIPGGWGLGGHAYTNEELVDATHSQLRRLGR